MLVFREGRCTITSALLLGQLESAVTAISSQRAYSDDAVLTALLQAGEVECALADAGSEAAQSAVAVTDVLANCLTAKSSSESLGRMLDSVSSAPLPSSLTISRPEGFAYYALHPLDYSEALSHANEKPNVAVIVGIRSIGTTLSATLKAHLSLASIPCDRFTVRPVGHPFDRKVELSRQERQIVARAITEDATFYVVDEGPGLSGSSFLATAEALLKAGIHTSKIVLLCSNQPNCNVLLARNAAERWKRFRTIQAKAGSHLPVEAATFWGGGRWREVCFESKQEWPASWVAMERLKFLSPDQRELFRFDGLGAYGAQVRERYARVAEAGYGPSCESAGSGFTQFPMIKGSLAQCVTRELVERAADYCAFRAQELAAEVALNSALEEMARVNVERELGCGIGNDFRLEIARPVLADGKMSLHEWLDPEDGGPTLKLDSAAHGDDHFFPGPTDIAWDLAGTIIEWQMDQSAADEFLARYERLTNDRVRARLRSYEIAYAAFRMGYSKMAAAAMSGQEEESRLRREYHRYRERLSGMLALKAVV
jgi:hypothetical protein